MPPTMWRNGLILGDHHIGDVLWRTNSLEHLKKGLPNCAWYYVTSRTSAQILDGNPFLAGILPFYTADKQIRLDNLSRDKLRSMKFDVALCTNKYGYWRELAMAVDLGIPNRVGYVSKGFSALVTHPIPLPGSQPFPAYFRDFVASLTNQKPDWALEPKIYISDADVNEARTFLNRLSLRKDRPWIALFITARTPKCLWPIRHVLQLIEILKNKVDAQIILCGSNKDQAALTGIASTFEAGVFVNAGNLKLKALAHFLSLCQSVFCADSGPRHIANAVGTAVVFIANISESQMENGVYCANETNLTPDLEYLTDAEQIRCLNDISPERVACGILNKINYTALQRGSGVIVKESA